MTVEEPHPHPRTYGDGLYGKMVAKVDRAYSEWKSAKDSGYGDSDHKVSRSYGRLEGAAAQLGLFRGNDTKTQIALAKERYDART